MAEAVTLALQTLAFKAPCCSHCGKGDMELKRCPVCKSTWYCGAVCQKAGWKEHRKICSPLAEVLDVVRDAHKIRDWQTLLKFKGRMEELLLSIPNPHGTDVLLMFSDGHTFAFEHTGGEEHLHQGIRLMKRRAEMSKSLQMGALECESLCSAGHYLNLLGRLSEATTYFFQARTVAQREFLFTIESDACLGLGEIEIVEHRLANGVLMMQSALAAAERCDGVNNRYELNALVRLIQALFDTKGELDTELEFSTLAELQKLVPRYKKAAGAQSEKDGKLFIGEFRSLFYDAQLHEVLNPRP
jgi:hypothetical protein